MKRSTDTLSYLVLEQLFGQTLKSQTFLLAPRRDWVGFDRKSPSKLHIFAIVSVSV